MITAIVLFATLTGCAAEPAYVPTPEDLIALDAVANGWEKTFPNSPCAYAAHGIEIRNEPCPTGAPGGCYSPYIPAIFVDEASVPNVHRDEIVVHEALHALVECETGSPDSYHEDSVWGLGRLEEYAVRRARGQVLD